MQLIPNALAQFIDSSGAPLASGTVGFYFPGTLNPKPTYQDAAGTIANTNPVTLDSRGQALIWGSGVYRQIVKDASGVTIWDQVTEDSNAGLIGNITDAKFVAGTDFTPGTTAQLTLPAAPGSISNLWIFFDASYQADDQIASINGLVLTFNNPIPVGVQEVNIKIGTTIAIGTPGSGSVTDSAVAANAGIDSSKLSFLQTGTGAQRRTVQSKLRDMVSVKDFGAQGDGTTDDTTAVQGALNSVAASGKKLYFPAGTYKVTAPLAATGNFTIGGDGMSATVVMFSNNANMALAGNAITTAPGPQMFVENISFQTSDTLNTSTALLNISFPSGGNGSTIRSVSISDVEVCGSTLAKGFNGGIRLFNATTLRVSRVRVANSNAGAGGYTTGSFGIQCDTDSQAGDWYIDQTNVYFCDNGIYGVGEGTNAGFEGLTVTDSLIVANNVGINIASSVYHLYTRLSGNNINCVSKCISIQNMFWIDITDNILYAYDTGATVPTWVGMNLLFNDVNHGLNSTNMIRGNVITGLTTSHATARDGIVFQANANVANSQTLIDANSFANLEFGLVLFSGTNNVTFTDANTMANVTTTVADSSGQTNNILAFGVTGNPGASRDNFGIEDRFGASVAVTLTGGLGSVTFAQPFKTACDTVIACNGNPAGGFSTNVVSVVDSSINSSGFGIQVGGVTTGTININYIAKGH